MDEGSELTTLRPGDPTHLLLESTGATFDPTTGTVVLAAVVPLPAAHLAMDLLVARAMPLVVVTEHHLLSMDHMDPLAEATAVTAHPLTDMDPLPLEVDVVAMVETMEDEVATVRPPTLQTTGGDLPLVVVADTVLPQETAAAMEAVTASVRPGSTALLALAGTVTAPAHLPERGTAEVLSPGDAMMTTDGAAPEVSHFDCFPYLSLFPLYGQVEKKCKCKRVDALEDQGRNVSMQVRQPEVQHQFVWASRLGGASLKEEAHKSVQMCKSALYPYRPSTQAPRCPCSISPRSALRASSIQAQVCKMTSSPHLLH